MAFPILGFDQQNAKTAGRLRFELKQKGTPIGAYECLIAGLAVARNLLLITNNTKEFKRIAELNYLDWLA